VHKPLDAVAHGRNFASIVAVAQAVNGAAGGKHPGLILIFYAFGREVADFKRRVKHRSKLPHRGLRGFRAEIAGREFAVVATGIGHLRALETARLAFEVMPAPEMVIGAGVVGALSYGLRPGDIVLADRVIHKQNDDAEALHVAAVHETHLRDVGRYLKVAGLDYSTGALLTSHRVLVSGDEKRRAKDETGAIAVDMETAALAVETASRGLPFAVLRTVLDHIDDEITGAEMMTDDQGRVRPLRATAHLMRHPTTMLKLPKLLRNMTIASESLANALEAIAHRGRPPFAIEPKGKKHKKKRGRH
jgi:adenosylhomocysteine nucleosidase